MSANLRTTAYASSPPRELNVPEIPVEDYRSRWLRLGESVVVDGTRGTASDTWLNTWHRLLLRTGSLWLPPSPALHDGVPVSIQPSDGPRYARGYAGGAEAIWVDCGVAEIVYRANQLGLRTYSSCEGGRLASFYAYDGDSLASIGFHQRGAHQLMSLIDGQDLDGVTAGNDWAPLRDWLRGHRLTSVEIPPDQLPEITRRLRAVSQERGQNAQA